MSKNVVCAVIEKSNKNKVKYLLVRVKRNFGKYTGYLQPVGGHVEVGEDEKGALAREVYEELGVKCEVGEKISETPLDIAGEMAHWYKCKLATHDFQLDSNEISSFEWLTLEEIENEEKIWPATKKFLLSLK